MAGGGGGGGGGGGNRRRRDYEAKSPGVRQIMDQLKVEVAAQLGIPNYNTIDRGDIPARIHGKIGGNMVRKMIEYAEASMLAGGITAPAQLVASTGTVGFAEGSTGGPDSVAMAQQAGLFLTDGVQ